MRNSLSIDTVLQVLVHKEYSDITNPFFNRMRVVCNAVCLTLTLK